MVCKAYRTVSGDALQVLAGVLPIDLKARERKDIFNSRREGRNDIRNIKSRYRSIWQERWNNSDKGRPLLHLLWPSLQDREN